MWIAKTHGNGAILCVATRFTWSHKHCPEIIAKSHHHSQIQNVPISRKNHTYDKYLPLCEHNTSLYDLTMVLFLTVVNTWYFHTFLFHIHHISGVTFVKLFVFSFRTISCSIWNCGVHVPWIPRENQITLLSRWNIKKFQDDKFRWIHKIEHDFQAKSSRAFLKIKWHPDAQIEILTWKRRESNVRNARRNFVKLIFSSSRTTNARASSTLDPRGGRMLLGALGTASVFHFRDRGRTAADSGISWRIDGDYVVKCWITTRLMAATQQSSCTNCANGAAPAPRNEVRKFDKGTGKHFQKSYGILEISAKFPGGRIKTFRRSVQVEVQANAISTSPKVLK